MGEWNTLWQRIVDLLVAALSSIVVEQQPTSDPEPTPPSPAVAPLTEPLTELWHLSVRGWFL